MSRFRALLLLAVTLLLLANSAPRQNPDTGRLWRDFLEWAKTQTGSRIAPENYRGRLLESGLSPAEADERMALLPQLYRTVPEFREQLDAVSYNKLYRLPEQTRFTFEPNAFLVATLKTLKPGKALDVAMGQGRNAVYTAAQGWDVTGFDIAEEGLRAACENAAKAGTHINTVKARFDNFDYGKDRWDLIYFVYTDAPIVDPNYVSRVREALKPGGHILIDRPFRSLTNPEWPETEQDKINALVKAWSDLQIVFYEDTTGLGDWQQTSADRLQHPLRIVRMLARKL